MSIDISIHKKLDDFELNIEVKSDARRIGILGASGCGKSMTLKSIAGVVNPDRGHIIVDGNVLYDSDNGINVKPQARNTGYLFQNYALFPTMTVASNIAAGIKMTGSKRNGKVDELTRLFKLEGLENRYPNQLSGGQKQRVALARMMATEPRLLLFDEPFSALDAFLRDGLRLELLDRLKKYDKTAIIVTHDRDEVYQMCDWLIIMDKGRVLASGDTKELFNAPKTPEVARLTGCKNISRIEKIDSHTIRLPEFGEIVLTTQNEVKDTIKYAGIRAHDFYPVAEKNSVNCIETGSVSVSEMPFEWCVTLENGLLWKFEKSLKNHSMEGIIPRYITVSPESIILMRENDN